jgi:hypothetical protein
MLGEEPYLSKKLLINIPFTVVYNAYDFQDESSTIATCGRWCILRAKTILNDGMSLPKFIDTLKGIKAKSNLPYDNIVSDLINGI